MKVYSLKSCDTCKKALAWLVDENVPHEVHDVRADGISNQDVQAIMDAVGWEVAVNRRSTTWRNLDDARKANIDAKSAIDLIVEHPTLLKRPVFVTGSSILVGFTKENQNQLTAFKEH